MGLRREVRGGSGTALVEQIRSRERRRALFEGSLELRSQRTKLRSRADVRRSAVELERESSQTLPARSPHHSIQQIRQVLGVGVVLHGLTDVVEQRAGFRVEASDLLIEIARQQLLVHLCVGHISSHHNHLGSGAVVIDRAGNKVETLTYFPYGGTRTDLPGTPVNVPYKYTGQELDSSTGFYDYGARQYEPALGRFTSPDTIVPDARDPQSLNRYSYAQNNPLRYIDPSGHFGEEAGGGDFPFFCLWCSPGITSTPDSPASQYQPAYQQPQVQDVVTQTAQMAMGRNAPQLYGAEFGAAFQNQEQLALARGVADQMGGIGVAIGGFVATGGISSLASLARSGWEGLSAFGRGLLGISESSVWELGPVARGRAIEQAFGGNLPSNFPVIDRLENGVVTSIKSLDLYAPSYQHASVLDRTISGYIDSVASFNGKTWSGVSIRPADFAGRSLDLVVPGPGSIAQQNVFNQAIQYEASRGVNVNVIPYR